MPNTCIYIFLICTLIANTLSAQDLHVSSFEGNNTILNPSHITDQTSIFCIQGISRQQWNSIAEPFTTQVLNIEKNSFIYNRIIHFNLQFTNQENGKKSNSINRFLLGLAYQQSNNNNQYTIGINAGYITRRNDFTNLSTPSQFDTETGQFNYQLESNENYSDNRFNTYIMNVGGAFKKITNGCNYELGLSLGNINLVHSNKLLFKQLYATKAGLYLKARIKTNNQIDIDILNTSQFTNHANELISGLIITYKKNSIINGISNFQTGAMIRHGIKRNIDALILQTGASWKRMELSFSYDINISSLHNSTKYKGATDICLKYTIPNNTTYTPTNNCQRY